MLFIEEKGRKQMTAAHQETLPAGNDAACPHLENWLCKYLNMNKYKIVTKDCKINALRKLFTY